MQTLVMYLVTMVTLFILDMIWLGFVAKQLYFDNIGHLLRRSGASLTPVWPAAILVYVFIALGIVYFVLPKANGDYLRALFAGAVFGAVTYGIYDFTNYAILAEWPYKITIIDFCWGIFLCSLTSLIVTFVLNRF